MALIYGCWSGVGGSEPERPSRVISLTTGRIPEPLNPGLHTVRTTAPWDSSRGALTAPVFSLDPCHERSGAAHNDPPVSIGTINTVERGSLCVPASSGVYGSLTRSRWARSQGLAAYTHSRLAHMQTGIKTTCSLQLRHILRLVCADRRVTSTKNECGQVLVKQTWKQQKKNIKKELNLLSHWMYLGQTHADCLNLFPQTYILYIRMYRLHVCLMTDRMMGL